MKSLSIKQKSIMLFPEDYKLLLFRPFWLTGNLADSALKSFSAKV